MSCSSSRQSSLVTALKNAQRLAQQSRDHLNDFSPIPFFDP